MAYISSILLVFCLTLSAFAETYRWVDDQGGVHFSDDPLKIPERYRSSTMKVEGESQDPHRKADEIQNKGTEAEFKDMLGRGASYWRGRVAEAKNKMRSLQETGEGLRVKYNELSTRFNGSKDLAERATIRSERDEVRQEIEKNRAEMEEAKNFLEKKIPEEAELYRAKPEWIK